MFLFQVNPDDYLPSVMTCANYLKLPDYSSKVPTIGVTFTYPTCKGVLLRIVLSWAKIKSLTFSGHHGREVEGGSCRGSILFPPLIDLLGFCRIREIVQECFYRQNISVRLLIRILLKRKELLHFLEISSDDINDISLVILD